MTTFCKQVAQLTQHVTNPIADPNRKGLMFAPVIPAGTKFIVHDHDKIMFMSGRFISDPSLIAALQEYLEVVPETVGPILDASKHTARAILARLMQNSELVMSDLRRIIKELDNMPYQEIQAMFDEQNM